MCRCIRWNICYFYTFIGVRNEELHKVIYLENRRFLPDTSELRNDSISFPSKKREMRPPLRCYATINSVHKAYMTKQTSKGL